MMIGEVEQVERKVTFSTIMTSWFKNTKSVTHQTLRSGKSYQNTSSMWKSRVSTHFITLAVANNCKMTWKSDIDDVMNTSKMSNLPQNFSNDSNVSKEFFISSPYKVFNLLAVANMFEKTPLDLCRVCTPFGVPRKPSSTYLQNEQFYPQIPKTILIKLAKKSFSYLEGRSQK